MIHIPGNVWEKQVVHTETDNVMVAWNSRRIEFYDLVTKLALESQGLMIPPESREAFGCNRVYLSEEGDQSLFIAAFSQFFIQSGYPRSAYRVVNLT